MNFDFTAEQYQLRDSIRDFLADGWTPQLRAATSGPGVPEQMWEGLTGLGLQMLLVPEAHGGLGLTLTDAALIFETFGETLAPGLLAETMVATDVIAGFGTPDQQADLLPAVAEGRLKPVLAMQEPGASFDPRETSTVATRGGNGWRLNGRKQMVPYAHLADRILVSARIEESPALGFFIVDPQTAGVSSQAHTLVDPTYRMSALTLADVALPSETLLGGEEAGSAVKRGMQVAAASAAAQLAGAAGQALAMTLDYAKQRRQFGRAIGSFQTIKHKLADMMVTYETSRSAAYYAHWALAQNDSGADGAVSLAKAYAGDMARTVLNESIHIHGGIGFTWEYDLHFFVKRGKVLEYSYGDAAWHREQYARVRID